MARLVAMAAILPCLVNSEDRTLAESLRDERAAFHATLGSPDMIEGMTAFTEKRRPEFNRRDTRQEESAVGGVTAGVDD